MRGRPAASLLSRLPSLKAFCVPDSVPIIIQPWLLPGFSIQPWTSFTSAGVLAQTTGAGQPLTGVVALALSR